MVPYIKINLSLLLIVSALLSINTLHAQTVDTTLSVPITTPLHILATHSITLSNGFSANGANGPITLSIGFPQSINGNRADTSFRYQMNRVFGNLDMSRVPFGLLKDYALELTDISSYNGINMAQSTLLNKSLLYQIYNTLATARVTAAAYTTLPNATTTDSVWNTYRHPGQVTLCGLFYQYAYFDANALAAGKIIASNNQYFDSYANGNWQNPYLTGKTIGFAPAAETYMGKSFNVLLPNSLWLSNSKGMVGHIELDAGDGQGYRTIIPDIAIPVNYADTGLKIWNFKVYLADNSILQSHTRLQVNADVYAQNNPPASQSQQVTQGVTAVSGNPSFFSINSSETYNGGSAYGYVTVQLAPGHTNIQKPLIIVEGIDYGKFTKPESKTGEHSLTDFLREVTKQSPSLTQLLNSNISTYDLIYIDYGDGADYIQRNALLVKEVIRWVNRQKAQNGSTEKNVIMGQSMGALVTRYALKTMENAGETHDTRLYISHDGPQQGVNLPVGYQSLVNHAENTIVETGFLGSVVNLLVGSPAFAELNAPASRQMIINYVDRNYNMDNTMHNQWQTELSSLGYPSQSNIRNVAISNGSECAQQQDVQAGGLLFLMDGQANTKILGDLANLLAAPFEFIATGKATFLLGVLPGSNIISLHFQVNASSTSGGNQVYNGNITYTKTLLWFIPITVTLTDKSMNAPSGVLGYENFAGSFLHVDALKSIEGESVLGGANLVFNGPFNFCYVSVPSVLDISGSSSNLSQQDYLTSYSASSPPVAPKSTPFANFVTAYTVGQGAINEDHISFETRNGDWLTKELNANASTPPPVGGCGVFCNSNTLINGPDFLNCSYTNATYQLNTTGISGLNGIVWTASKGFTISGANNGTSVSVTLNGNDNSIGIVSASVISDCGTISIGKRVTLTPPSPSIVQLYTKLNRNTVHVIVNFPNYGWDLNYYIDGQLVLSTPSKDLYLQSSCGSHLLGVTASTDCGESGFGYQNFTIPCGYSASKSLFYPNPANNQLNIKNPNVSTNRKVTSANSGETSIMEETSTYSVELFNDKGKMLKSGKNTSGEQSIQLDTSDLSNGTYYLHIKQGSELYEKQIVIQHSGAIE